MRQPLITNKDKAQLKRIFRKDLAKEVTVRLFTQKQSPVTVPGRECRYCAQTQQLMEELTELSTKVHLEIIDFYQQPQAARESGVVRIPAIILSNSGASRVKFYGCPMGYPLATVVEGIKTVSRGVSPLNMGTRKSLRQVNQPVHIQVFVTPSDTSCPGVARLAHAFALDCHNITADVLEVQEYPDLGKAYSVRSVPTTVINEHVRLAGAITETQLLEKVLQVGVGTTQEAKAAAG